MLREYGRGTGVVRFTFYVLASHTYSSPERKKKETKAGVGTTNFHLWICSNHMSSFGNLTGSHHISLCIRGVGRSNSCSYWRWYPRRISISGRALGQWRRHGVTEVYLSGSLQQSGTYPVGGIKTVLARVRRQPVASLACTEEWTWVVGEKSWSRESRR
jgi:hypothetical protein